MINEIFSLLSAESTNLIIQCETKLKDLDIKCRVIPLPAEISASCGLAIKIQLEDLNRAIDILKKMDVHMKAYRVERNGLKKNIDLLYSF